MHVLIEESTINRQEKKKNSRESIDQFILYHFMCSGSFGCKQWLSVLGHRLHCYYFANVHLIR